MKNWKIMQLVNIPKNVKLLNLIFIILLFGVINLNASLETGQRYLKLSYSYLTAENPVKAEQAIDIAYDHIFSLSGNDYWKAAAYEYAGYILYFKHKEDEALKYFYKAYDIYLNSDDVLDGSDEAMYKLIKDRYPADWEKVINEYVHHQKREWKVKNIYASAKLSKMEECKRRIKLANSYFNVNQTSGNPDDLILAKTNIYKAEELALFIDSDYWKAAVNETLSYLEFGDGEMDEAQARLKMSHDSFMKLIKSKIGSDEATYEVMQKFNPGSELIRKDDIDKKSWLKLQRLIKRSPARVSIPKQVEPANEQQEDVKIDDNTSGR